MRKLQMRRILIIGALCAVGGAIGCGGSSATVQGKTLAIRDQAFGSSSGNYCDTLTIYGQFEVILDDLSDGICGKLGSSDGGAPAGQPSPFHSATDDVTFLRLVFPSALMSVNVKPFKVAATDCNNSSGDGEAAAFFVHNTKGATTFDLAVAADSGTITVGKDDYDKGAGTLKGSYDLNFGKDHVTGKFDSTFCRGIVPGVGTK